MYWTAESFPIGLIREAPVLTPPVGNPKTTKRRLYKNLVCAFDIETTRIKEIEQSFMYIWQCQIEDETIFGRTWPEWLHFLDRLRVELADDTFIVFWIHNASYEFQFIRGIYPFHPEEVFAVEPRRILRFDMYNHFEFRCSYLQTNMSLAEFTHKMGVEAQKLSGEEFDYSKFRTPATPLTMREIEYCTNDVKGLVQAIKKEMEFDGDDLYSIPRTSTGYVRREAKKAMRDFNRNFLKDMLPDYEVYQMLREAFRGGNTHANRYYVGKILHDVSSADRSSSYPDCQVNDRFPMGAWRREYDTSTERFIELCGKHKRAVLARVAFVNVRLRNKLWGCPYLARAKCRNTLDGEYDNGRILCASYTETTITDVDADIILSEYDFDDLIIIKMFSCRYGYLPTQITDLTKKYYTDKTALKGDPEQEIYYYKQKGKLNSIYGMSVQCPTKPDIVFENGEFKEADQSEEEQLIKHNRTAFQSYAWGVWVCCWGRFRLEEGIRMAGVNFVYADTDSVKYLGSIDWTQYNNVRKRRSTKNGAFAVDRKGKTHYMGVYEFEGKYREFATLGAKKYAYRDEAGELHVTIAGVNKKKGAEELECAGGLEAFKSGFVFYDGGGTEAVYNDDPGADGVTEWITPDGEHIPITANVVIRESTYRLGITGEYQRLIEFPGIWLQAVENFR